MCPADTTPEAWRVFLEIQRRMSPGEKLARTLEFSETLRRLAEAAMRRRYPQAAEHEIFLRVTRQNLGGELFRKAYGDAFPDEVTHARP